MYTKSAELYDRLYHFKDYEAASRELHARIHQYHPRARRLLDVACGTGRHLEHLGAWYDVSGLDTNDALLKTARQRCPQAPLYRADMTDFSLDASFDVITCLFSSIAYVKTEERLASALLSMSRHLQPGGLIVVEPWFSPESYWTGTITANFVDDRDIKIAWMYTSGEPVGGVAVLDIHYLVGTVAGVDHFTERHEFGVFSDDQYRSAIGGAGLSVEHDPEGPFGRGLYFGRRPPSTYGPPDGD